jgi:hypothetical protein
MLFPQSCSSPLITEDLQGMLLSWCLLLNITGLEALGSAKRYGTPSKTSLISKTRLAGSFPSSPARRASVLGPLSSFSMFRMSDYDSREAEAQHVPAQRPADDHRCREDVPRRVGSGEVGPHTFLLRGPQMTTVVERMFHVESVQER